MISIILILLDGRLFTFVVRKSKDSYSCKEKMCLCMIVIKDSKFIHC